MNASGRRAQAEEHRRSVERALRPHGGTPEDRDAGLEQAWHRRVGGMRLEGQGQTLELLGDGRYRGRFPDGIEEGSWTLTSCVGRVSLMLRPREGASYGFILRRDGQRVVLNGEGHATERLSAV